MRAAARSAVERLGETRISPDTTSTSTATNETTSRPADSSLLTNALLNTESTGRGALSRTVDRHDQGQHQATRAQTTDR